MLSEGKQGGGEKKPAVKMTSVRVNLLSPNSSLFVPPTPKQQAEREWK